MDVDTSRPAPAPSSPTTRAARRASEAASLGVKRKRGQSVVKTELKVDAVPAQLSPPPLPTTALSSPRDSPRSPRSKLCVQSHPAAWSRETRVSLFSTSFAPNVSRSGAERPSLVIPPPSNASRDPGPGGDFLVSPTLDTGLTSPGRVLRGATSALTLGLGLETPRDVGASNYVLAPTSAFPFPMSAYPKEPGSAVLGQERFAFNRRFSSLPSTSNLGDMSPALHLPIWKDTETPPAASSEEPASSASPSPRSTETSLKSRSTKSLSHGRPLAQIKELATYDSAARPTKLNDTSSSDDRTAAKATKARKASSKRRRGKSFLSAELLDSDGSDDESEPAKPRERRSSKASGSGGALDKVAPAKKGKRGRKGPKAPADVHLSDQDGSSAVESDNPGDEGLSEAQRRASAYGLAQLRKQSFFLEPPPPGYAYALLHEVNGQTSMDYVDPVHEPGSQSPGATFMMNSIAFPEGTHFDFAHGNQGNSGSPTFSNSLEHGGPDGSYYSMPPGHLVKSESPVMDSSMSSLPMSPRQQAAYFGMPHDLGPDVYPTGSKRSSPTSRGGPAQGLGLINHGYLHNAPPLFPAPTPQTRAAKAAGKSKPAKSTKATKAAATTTATSAAKVKKSGNAETSDASAGPAASKERRPIKRWTSQEIQSLVDGVRKYGIGNWSQIFNDPSSGFQARDDYAGRTAADLYEKWRLLVMPSKILKHKGNSNAGAIPSKISAYMTDEEYDRLVKCARKPEYSAVTHAKTRALKKLATWDLPNSRQALKKWEDPTQGHGHADPSHPGSKRWVSPDLTSPKRILPQASTATMPMPIVTQTFHHPEESMSSLAQAFSHDQPLYNGAGDLNGEDAPLLEVEKIVDAKVDERGRAFFLVKWLNLLSLDNTWEPYSNLMDCEPKILAFLQKAIKASLTNSALPSPGFVRAPDKSNPTTPNSPFKEYFSIDGPTASQLAERIGLDCVKRRSSLSPKSSPGGSTGSPGKTLAFQAGSASSAADSPNSPQPIARGRRSQSDTEAERIAHHTMATTLMASPDDPWWAPYAD